MKLHFFSESKVVHENINDHQIVECPICNREIKPYWELRYYEIKIGSIFHEDLLFLHA